MQTTGRPILVTGAIRSGSTWVGRMLAQAPQRYYVHEPFNPATRALPGFAKLPVQHWFEHVSPANEHRYREPTAALVGGRYRLRADPGAVTPGQFRAALRRYRRYRDIRRSGMQPVLKDPLAIFSAEWLAERFDTDVVITIRHPASFVSSIRRLQWPIDHCREILDQDTLMTRFLAPFEEEIARSRVDDDLIDQAALTWKLIYHVVDCYRAMYPNWHFVRHEDLSQDAESGFQRLYAALGLEFDDGARASVRSHSSSGNAKETPLQKGRIRHAGSIRVDSRENLNTWRNRLTTKEILRIRERVGEVAERFYDDASWA